MEPFLNQSHHSPQGDGLQMLTRTTEVSYSVNRPPISDSILGRRGRANSSGRDWKNCRLYPGGQVHPKLAINVVLRGKMIKYGVFMRFWEQKG